MQTAAMPDPASGQVKMRALAAIAGIPEQVLDGLLRRAGVPRRSGRGGGVLLRWSDVERGVPLQALVEERVRARERGFRVRANRWIVSGFPELVAQFDSEKNGDLTPWRVTAGSNKRIWWKCPRGPDHEWRTAPSNRCGLGTGCPFCAGRRASVTNSLGVHRPDLATQFHPNRNGRLTPHDIPLGSGRVVWWSCPRGPDHEWTARPSDRIRHRSVCPFCAGQRASAANSLALHRPDLAAQWHPSRNGRLTPHDLLPGSARRVWWSCPRGTDHEWLAAARDRIRQGTGCPFCAGQRASAANCLAALAPEIAREWHPTRNAPLTPADIGPKSGRAIWWKCDKGPDHEWRARPISRTQRTAAGTGCPFCARKKLSVTTALSAVPRIARQWHPLRNAPLTPRQVSARSDRAFWWKCDKGPDHEWRTTVHRRTVLSTGCPFCRGRRLSVTSSLAAVAPGIAREWHPTLNGSITPSDVVAVSGRAFWWQCLVVPAHVWRTSPQLRKRGHGCPGCARLRRRRPA